MLSQTQKQRMSLEQGLRLNQQMLQSIQLLGLSALELHEHIAEEVAKNPALLASTKKETLSPLGKTGALRSTGSGAKGADSKSDFIEGALSRGASLQDVLLEQLRMQKADAEVLAAGERIIGNLDGDGFNVVSAAELFTDGASAVIEAAYALVQSLEPQGCATADYKESLAVQGRLKFRNTAWEETLNALLPFLKELETGNFGTAAQKTGLSEYEVEKFFIRLKKLSPFPGRHLEAADGGDVRFVTPDIEVLRDDEGELVIKLNEDFIPALRVSPYFERLARERDRGVRDFVKENIAGARWFMNALARRNDTLLRVTKAIVERQQLFFEKGPAYIAPLTRREVAQALELGESTVSRLANSKYIQTEWGLFEASYFFSIGVGEGGASKTSVKDAIQEILRGADGKRPSDMEITRILEERGIKIARRTVAKYRGELESG